MNYCVVTTINEPTAAIEKLYELFGTNLIIVGDKKTPQGWNYKGVVPIRRASKLYTPDNHYARKNIGYLSAIKNGAKVIYDTDDDNIPNVNWAIREKETIADESIGEGWFNVYDLFGHGVIWPRGFSLRHLKEHPSCGGKTLVMSSIQQGLADGDPDVDAIWRLALQKNYSFKEKQSIYLKPKVWCPFNSQSTWWFPEAFPLMYLPVNASFRMTDIWRSFIAQRCLWEIGHGVTFHSPSEVYQYRNEHDLMEDFKDEIPGYLHNDEIVEILTNLKLLPGRENMCKNLTKCYERLAINGILPAEEIYSVTQWINDYENATGNI
jgi:hypothetical protein